MSSSSTEFDRRFRTDCLLVDLKGRTVRGAAVTVGSQISRFVIGLAATMVLARLLSPKEYGMLAMVATATGFVAILRDGGLSTATIQRPEINESQVSALFWINASIGLALAIFTAAVSPLVGWFFGERALVPVTVAMGLPFLIGGLMVQHQALLVREMRLATLAGIDIVSLVISAGAGIWAAASGWSYWALVLMTNLGWLINAALVIYSCHWCPLLPRRKAGVRSMVTFGGALTLNNLLEFLASSVDKISLGKLFGAEVLGLYTRSQALMLTPFMQIVPAMTNVILPALSRLTQRPAVFRKVYLDLIQVASFGCAFIASYMFVSAEWLVQIFLGEQWADATVLLQLFAWPTFFLPLGALCVTGLMARGDTVALMRWGAIKSAATIIAILIGLLWGATGVAAAISIVSLFVLMPVMFHIIAREGLASQAQLAAAAAPGAIACVLECGILYSVRTAWHIETPWAGLIILLAINGILQIAIIGLVPPVRRAFCDFLSVFSLGQRQCQVVSFKENTAPE